MPQSDTPAALAALDTRLGQLVDAVSDTAFLCGESTDDAVLFLSYRRQLSAAKAALTDQLAALLAAARQGEEDTANMDWLQSHFVDVVPVRLRTGEWGYVIRPLQEDLPLRDALRAARAAAQPEEVSRG